jgi:cell wall-associated NlpC family hydrolase
MKKVIASVVAIILSLGFGTAAQAQHYVKSGESLSKIAKQYNMSLQDIIDLNPHMEDPDLIHPNDYIIIRSKNEPKKDMVAYAQSLQDITTYVYGGNNFPYQVDCSAWVQGIFKKFGVDLPRVSRDQAKTGTPVTFEELQLGDLMFFSTRPDKVITHVSIYLGDDLWISNLNENKDVEIMTNWGSWTQKFFLWGARYEM